MTRRIENKSKVESPRSKVKSAMLIAFLLLTFNFQLSTVDCFSATKVLLHDAASQILPTPSWLFKSANSTQGSSKVTAVTNTIAGDVTGQYWPDTVASHVITKTAAGTKTIWISSPISTASVTVSSSITFNFWGLESSTSANSAYRVQVLRWSVASGGIVSSVGITTDNGTPEWTGSATEKTAPALTPTSTGFVAGDRIVIVVYNDDGNGVTETASSRTMTVDYDGATGVDGDTYVNFTENLTFSADSNNAPAKAPLAFLRSPLDRWAEYFHEVFA